MSSAAPSVRNVLGAGSALVPPVAFAVLALVLWPESPEQVATHWPSSGGPDAFEPRWRFLTEAAVVIVPATVLAMIVLVRARDPRVRAVFVGSMTGIAAVITAAWSTSTWLSTTSPDIEHEPLGWWLAVPIGALLWGLVPWAVLRGGPAPMRDGPDALDVPGATDHDIGATSTWHANAGSRVIASAGVMLLVVTIGVGVWLGAVGSVPVADLWAPLIAPAVVGVVAAVFGGVRIDVDPTGMRVRSVLGGIPVMRVPIERIDVVVARHVTPTEWGGWWLRISGRGVAYITGPGPGIVVTLDTGQRRVVSCAEAEDAAATLRGVLARRTTAGR